MEVSEKDVCGICRCCLSKQKYRLHSSGSLYQQLRRVCGRDMPASLPSQFACRTCKGQIQRAEAQRVRYEESRRSLVTNLRVSTSMVPTLLSSSPSKVARTPSSHGASSRTALTPTRLRQARKRPMMSPFAATGVSPLAKRPTAALSDATNTARPTRVPVRKLKLAQRQLPLPRVELFPPPVQCTGEAPSLPTNPPLPMQSRIPRLPLSANVIPLLQQVQARTNTHTKPSRIPLPSRMIHAAEEEIVIPTNSESIQQVLSEAIARGDINAVVKAIVCSSPTQELVMKHLLQQLHHQCQSLCQKKAFSSILRGLQPVELASFSFSHLVDEWASNAPLFLQFLSTAANVNLSASRVNFAGLCSAGSILLRERNVHLSALHHIVGLILFHGNASKLAHLRLNHLRLAVSPDATLAKVNQFGCRFDEKVLRWMENIRHFSSGEFVEYTPYQIIGDNVDIHQRASHQSSDRRDKDHHWFHMYAVRDRVTGVGLPNESPITDVAKLPLQTYLPSAEECNSLREEFGVLIARVITDKIEYLKPLKPVVPLHMKHKYSDTMTSKSDIVPLGVLTKSEQVGDDMIDIMTHIHQYVPRNSIGGFVPIFFGGDQLTRERANGALDARLQSSTPLGRLEGVIPKIEDWHALVCFYQVIWSRLFKPNSFCDKGTLKQLGNMIGRTNIPLKVKKDFSAARDFLSVVLDAHIVAAALQFFKMEGIDNTPNANVYMGNFQTATNDKKCEYLSMCVKEITANFVLPHVQTLDRGNITCSDGVFSYACSVLGLGLMARNFGDATREGDGERPIRIWKFFMLYFKADKHTKYAVEAFNLLSQVNATLTAQMSHRLVWNRMCNVDGGEGRNIALDLQNEHLNRVFKDDINTFCSNISDSSVTRSSQAIGPMTDMLRSIDKMVHVKKPCGRHITPSVAKDFDSVLKVLIDEEVFLEKDGRHHKSFPTFDTDPFAPLKRNPDAFKKWLIKRRKAATIEHQIATRVF